MKIIKQSCVLLLAFSFVCIMSCDGIQHKNESEVAAILSPSYQPGQFTIDTILNSENLKLVRLSPHCFQHISYLNTNDFGRVSCNGMVVINDNDAIIFDTPADDESSEELINFLTQKLKSKIIGIVPTHFHEDCVGGMQAFHSHQIPAYASKLTIKLLKDNGNKYATDFKGFDDSLVLNVGDKNVIARYFGEGHTKDNITGYFPADRILFGGCLVKELNATKGFLGDANVKAWPATVAKLKSAYPKVKMVIPGHGISGDTSLLSYTELLFQ